MFKRAPVPHDDGPEAAVTASLPGKVAIQDSGFRAPEHAPAEIRRDGPGSSEQGKTAIQDNSFRGPEHAPAEIRRDGPGSSEQGKTAIQDNGFRGPEHATAEIRRDGADAPEYSLGPRHSGAWRWAVLSVLGALLMGVTVLWLAGGGDERGDRPTPVLDLGPSGDITGEQSGSDQQRAPGPRRPTDEGVTPSTVPTTSTSVEATTTTTKPDPVVIEGPKTDDTKPPVEEKTELVDEQPEPKEEEL